MKNAYLNGREIYNLVLKDFNLPDDESLSLEGFIWLFIVLKNRSLLSQELMQINCDHRVASFFNVNEVHVGSIQAKHYTLLKVSKNG